MKIVTFTENHRTRLGVLREDGVVDLATHAPQLPHTMISFLRMGPAAMEEARAAADKAASTIPLARCQLLAPVPRPTKVLAIGLNYADHAKESGVAVPRGRIGLSLCVVPPANRIEETADGNQLMVVVAGDDVGVGSYEFVEGAIPVCLRARTRELLERHLVSEEKSADWLESQLHAIREVGRERYLAEQLDE